jgi:uncharacterized protein
MITLDDRRICPWYRQPWPWLLALGPVTVIVAGAITVWLAIASDDGLVADDYYKQGLAINEVLHRDDRAAQLGLRANVLFNFDNRRLRVLLTGETAAPAAAALRLRVLHPTRAGADQTLRLSASSPGVFDGALADLSKGRWLLQLEDADRNWRLTGEMVVPRDVEVALQPRPL